MRHWIVAMAAVVGLWPCMVLASLPGTMMRQGGLLPVPMPNAPAHATGALPAAGEAHFFPLPPRNKARMIALKPTAKSIHENNATLATAVQQVETTPNALPDSKAKVLLSIFNPGD